MPASKYDIQLDLQKRPNTSHAFVVTMTGANKRVLDVGCDTGYLGRELAAFGNTVSGFEINPDAADVARKDYQRVEVGDLETADLFAAFDGAQFDIVIFADVLEHLRDPLPVLRSARRLIAPGGSALISVPNIAHGDIRLALLRGRFRYTKVGLLDDTHTRFFTRDTLVEFVHEAGFALAEMRRVRMPLFKTETEVKEDDYPADLVAALRNDPEATTYQFVVRVVPDDATQIDSERALLLDRLTTELDEQRRLVADLRRREKALSTRVDELARQAKQAAPRRSSVARRVARRVRDWSPPKSTQR